MTKIRERLHDLADELFFGTKYAVQAEAAGWFLVIAAAAALLCLIVLR